MIIGLGSDLCNIERIQNSLDRFGERFENRVFTDVEREKSDRRANRAASYAKRGVLPESGGTWYLPRMLGWAKASEIIFTGRTLSANECLAEGLANVVVPADQVQAEARRMAAEIAANAPLAVTSAKRMMRMGLEETFPTHVQHVYLQLLPLFASDDFQEGIRSFLEKRPAQFTGR